MKLNPRILHQRNGNDVVKFRYCDNLTMSIKRSISKLFDRQNNTITELFMDKNNCLYIKTKKEQKFNIRQYENKYFYDKRITV